MSNLSKSHHQWFIAILIFIVVVAGLLFGIDAYGESYLSHNLEIINMTLVFVNTAMIIVVAAILVKIEDDLSKHDLKVEGLHKLHSDALAKMGKKKR